MEKQLYNIGEQPPLGEVPAKMNAWLIRENRFGQPTSSFQKEVVDVPAIADDDVLVYVMAAGVNYNNVWAALGIPVNVIKARQKGGEKEDFHIGGSDASGIVYAVGKDVKNVKVGDEVVVHCATWDRNDPWVTAGNDPMYSPSFRIWGYETNFGSFAQFTRVQAHQCMPKPKHMTWEEAASYVLVAATAWRMLHGWPEHEMQPDDPVLIWGGAGGLGSMAIQIAKAAGAIPVAVVSGDDKVDYCVKLGAKGCIDRRKFDHWGMLPHWKDTVGYNSWLKGVRAFGAAIWDVLGEKRSPKVVFEHPGESTIPTSMFVCDTGGQIVICAGTTGYNATIDLRYLWMRQKRFQGSHFANDEQCYAMNELALAGKLNPCMSRAFTYEELPLAHQLMHDNQHPHGNMAVLIGAPDFGLGKSAPAPTAAATPTLPKGDLHDPKARHPYPVSAPLPDVATVFEVPEIHDDGTLVRDRMHAGIVSCARTDSVAAAGKVMIDNDIHALMVIENDRAVGVLSQTDIVLARQGRTMEEARSLTVGSVMTEGCATIDAGEKLSFAISEMMKRRIHRLVVTEKGVPVGVLSMTDIVRNLIG
ncbi:MAG: crotonyl-CoA carboxylase/reductase [Rhodospirillales bacterium]|nr:crotonyl-CoA carboxylase/reductase [Rhodospirillales bacterium]